MSGHTPGPWRQEALGAQLRAVRISGDQARRIVPAGGPALAYLPQGREDIQKANAWLIAAAPDMLEALTAAWHALRSYQHGNSSPDLAEEVADRAEAVIAKAEGR